MKEKGKTSIVWNDSLRGGTLPADAVVQMWMGDKDLITEFVNRGGKFIQSSTECHYLDYPYFIWDTHALLDSEPCPDYLAGKDALLGIECPLWMERVVDLERFFYQMLPRIPAMAECAWTAEAARDNESFDERYVGIEAFLNGKGIYGAPREYWKINEETAAQERKEYERILYTPENLAEFEKQGKMMEEERAIYGDER